MANTNYPLVAIVGSSGTGKSYSLKNLPIDKTKILNIERKPFPFKHGFQYGANDIQCPDIPTFDAQLDRVLKDKTVDYIVIESMTKYFEMLLTFSKGLNKGYEIYNFYNDRITMFLERIKNNQNKVVFCIAIDEVVKTVHPSGAETSARRVKVAGKQWEGTIEKEFAIVLYTDVKQEKGKSSTYQFMVNNDGTCSAKSPPDMFTNQQFVANDLLAVAKSVLGYYELKPQSDTQPETAILNTPIK